MRSAARIVLIVNLSFSAVEATQCRADMAAELMAADGNGERD